MEALEIGNWLRCYRYVATDRVTHSSTIGPGNLVEKNTGTRSVEMAGRHARQTGNLDTVTADDDLVITRFV